MNSHTKQLDYELAISIVTDWALALVKGNREPHEAKKKSFDLGGNRTHDLRIRSTVTLPTELQGRTEKVGVVGSIPTELKRFFLCLVWFPVFLY